MGWTGKDEQRTAAAPLGGRSSAKLPYTALYMELSKKLTILVTPDLHARLMKVSKDTGKSMGELIRQACEQRYGPPQPDTMSLDTISLEDRVAALEALLHRQPPDEAP